MASLPPMFASETKAAQLLDMKPADFRKLVDGGHLPKGREIAPGVVRWDVDALRQIGGGGAIEGERIQW